MAHDNSLASKTEEWIVTQLRALAPFDANNCEVFPGSTAPDGAKLIDELLGNRPIYACVLFEGDQPRPLEEGEQAYDPTYGIYVVVQNERPGTGRTGDGTTIGTNGLRDLMRNALHDQFPDFGANGFWTDDTEFRGVQIVFQRKDAFVMRAEVAVRESPQA